MYARLPNFDSNEIIIIITIISSLETSNFTIYLTSPYPYKARFLLLLMNAHRKSWRMEDLFMTLAY